MIEAKYRTPKAVAVDLHSVRAGSNPTHAQQMSPTTGSVSCYNTALGTSPDVSAEKLPMPCAHVIGILMTWDFLLLLTTRQC